jgi:hypothetical protein
MNRYIKTNVSNEIIDHFFEYQKSKFDGTEIFIEDTQTINHRINGKSISNEYGIWRFTWDGMSISEKSQATIDSETLTIYKQIKQAEIQHIIINRWPLDIDRRSDAIFTQWAAIKADSVNWTTLAEVDTAFNNAMTWLGL